MLLSVSLIRVSWKRVYSNYGQSLQIVTSGEQSTGTNLWNWRHTWKLAASCTTKEKSWPSKARSFDYKSDCKNLLAAWSGNKSSYHWQNDLSCSPISPLKRLSKAEKKDVEVTNPFRALQWSNGRSGFVWPICCKLPSKNYIKRNDDDLSRLVTKYCSRKLKCLVTVS